MRTSIMVSPTPESVRRLQDIVESTVLVLNGDLMNLEVIATEQSQAPIWVPDEGRVYTDVRVTDVQVDTQIATGGAITRLVATVESASLGRRRQELGGNYNSLFHWILMYDVPPGRSVKLTISHLTDVLVYREAPFSFSDEMLLQV